MRILLHIFILTTIISCGENSVSDNEKLETQFRNSKRNMPISKQWADTFGSFCNVDIQDSAHVSIDTIWNASNDIRITIVAFDSAEYAISLSATNIPISKIEVGKARTPMKEKYYTYIKSYEIKDNHSIAVTKLISYYGMGGMAGEAVDLEEWSLNEQGIFTSKK